MTLFMTLVALFAGSAAMAQAQPVVAPGGVVNGASYTSPVVAGGAATIYGTNLASSTVGFAGAQPLPTTLAGTSVQIGGYSAPLYYVSPGQINIQIPWELAGQTQAYLTVTTAAGTSSPVAVSLVSWDPALFSFSLTGTGQGVIYNSNNTPNGATNPAPPGGTVQIAATDLGPVTNQPADGTAPSAPADTTTVLGVTIGGLPAVVTASQLCGPSPTCAVPDSSYLITAQVPAKVAEGLAVPVVVSMGKFSKSVAVSNTVTMAVAFPGTVVEAPGLGCSTSYGTDRFSPVSWSYVANPSPKPSTLSITKASDDCTTRLFRMITAGTHLASATVTQFDASGTQPLQLVTFQGVVLSQAKFAGGSASGVPNPEDSVVFEAKSVAIQ